MPTPPSWQLPVGVDAALWDYVHDATLAERYDESLRDSPLLACDLDFALAELAGPGRAVGRLLDVGCGTGRASFAFATRGFEVTAVDLSESMLAVVARKAAAAGLSIECLRANIAELDELPAGVFVGAVCLFGTLGMLVGEAARRRCLLGVQRALAPGGRLVVHVHNRWHALTQPGGRAWLAASVWRWLTRGESLGDRVCPPHQGLGRLRMHLFSRRGIVHLLHSCGLRVRRIVPVGLRTDGRLPWPWLAPAIRAQGYLICAQRD